MLGRALFDRLIMCRTSLPLCWRTFAHALRAYCQLTSSDQFGADMRSRSIAVTPTLSRISKSSKFLADYGKCEIVMYMNGVPVYMIMSAGGSLVRQCLPPLYQEDSGPVQQQRCQTDDASTTASTTTSHWPSGKTQHEHDTIR